jgi:thiol-disulfide isomerase/thioredoxin
MIFRLFLLSTLAFSFLACCSSNSVTENTDEPEPELSFPECSQKIDAHPCNFSLSNQHGDEVSLYDFYGKVIIVDLSAMWCGPCSNMAYAADPTVDAYGADNLEWLTVIIDNESGDPPTQEDVKRWADVHGVTGHVLVGDRSFIATDPELKTGYPVSGWPTFVVIDQEMILRYGVTGWSETMLQQILDSLIDKSE